MARRSSRSLDWCRTRAHSPGARKAMDGSFFECGGGPFPFTVRREVHRARGSAADGLLETLAPAAGRDVAAPAAGGRLECRRTGWIRVDACVHQGIHALFRHVARPVPASWRGTWKVAACNETGPERIGPLDKLLYRWGSSSGSSLDRPVQKCPQGLHAFRDHPTLVRGRLLQCRDQATGWTRLQLTHVLPHVVRHRDRGAPPVRRVVAALKQPPLLQAVDDS